MRPTPAPTRPRARRVRQPVPLAVWPCAQVRGQQQRAGRYLPQVRLHPGEMLPELARRILTDYTHPGWLVVDPMCGIGTTLVEAAALGRHAVGVELEARWAELAAANLDHALPADRRALARVYLGDARRLPELLGGLTGGVDAVVTAPPYACAPAVIDKRAWWAGGPLEHPGTANYSTDPANLGHARGTQYDTELARVYAGCFRLLRAGGLLVVVTKNTRQQGRLTDLASLTVALARQAGFGYLQHVIALGASIRGDRLAAHPSFWQLWHLRRAHARGQPFHLVVHEDVLVFTKPASPGLSPASAAEAAHG